MSSNAGNLDGITVTVDHKEVAATPELELLGTVMDRRFLFLPHAKATSRAARQRASVIARLSNHLPPGRYFRTLAMGLAVGKVIHALPEVIAPRLSEAAPITANSGATQIALNDVARSVTGAKRTDLVNITYLLSKARMTPLNRLAAASAGIEAWKVFRSTDGPDGGCYPLGHALFDQRLSRPLRSAAAGEICVPLCGCNTLVNTAATIWNKSPALRSAATLALATRATNAYAKTVPIM
jgi:hypothetical protein